MHLELRSQTPPSRRARRPAGFLPALLRVLPLLATLLLSPAGIVLAQSAGFAPAEVGDSRDRVLADSRYQTEMPAAEAPTERKPFTIPPWLAKAIFWTLVVVILLAVAFFLFQLAYDLLRDRSPFKRNRESRAAAPERVETPVAAPREVDPRSLAEADRLAGEGRFSEAIHLLLLVAMARLQRELGPRVAHSLTGREVLRLPTLPDGTVAPLTRMVQLSEINHFGGRAAHEPDYRTARADYLAFSGEAPVSA